MPVLRSTSAFFSDNASLMRKPVEAMSPNSVSKMTPHELRAMARTIMVERLNAHPDVIEAQLAHEKSGPLGAAYDRAEFMEQRRHMMKAWADYLEELRLRPATTAKRYLQPAVAASAGQKISAGRATKRSAVLESPAEKT